jgi:hypothetical protein|tara:strand:+ start:401 stop:553 length:153 start_codon:yes stop_codon:yes gene_type:complete
MKLPHKMYSKSGQVKTAKTNKEHLALKAKGWSHSNPKAKVKAKPKMKKGY